MAAWRRSIKKMECSLREFWPIQKIMYAGHLTRWFLIIYAREPDAAKAKAKMKLKRLLQRMTLRFHYVRRLIYRS